MGNISDALQNLKDEIRSSREERNTWQEQLHADNKVTISEIRSDVHNLVRRFRQEDTERKGAVNEMLAGFQTEDTERKGAASEMLKGFQAEDTERKGAVNEMLTGFRKTNNELREEVASDLRQAHQIWTGGLKKRIKPRATVREVKEEPKAEAGPPTEEKILEVIAGHPEGIRLVDLGNELGVDWRGLIGPSKSLVDAAQVEKIENMYYPKKEE